MTVLLAGMVCGAALPARAELNPPRVAVFFEEMPGADRALAEALLETAGSTATLINAEQLADLTFLDPGRGDVLLLPNAGPLPAAATDAINRWLEGGGNLVALNAPLWQERMLAGEDGWDQAWNSRNTFEQEAASDIPARLLFDFSGPDPLAEWTRSVAPETEKAVHEVVPDSPAPGGQSLHVYMDTLRSWETYLSPEIGEAPFPDGHTLTVFAAKGGPDTHTMAVEWTESDGSRWIATIALTEEWRRYVLAPEDFLFWESNPQRVGTKFNPANAVRFTMGLSMSHTGAINGVQEYWITLVGTEAPGERNIPLLKDPGIAPRDALFPNYKYYEITEPAVLRACADQAVLPGVAWPDAASLRSPHPRPGGGGFDKGRDWRWIPLIEARGTGDAWRGTPGVLTVRTGGEDKGGQWAVFSVDDPAWYRQQAVQDALKTLLQRMSRGVYMVDGGTNYYTYFENQRVRAGMRVVNVSGSQHDQIEARVTIANASTGETAFTKTWPVSLEPGEERTLDEGWTPAAWPDKGFMVTAELLEQGTVIDRVEHEAHVWRPRADIPRVVAENGMFTRDGKPWRAHGVNYMPSSGLATEDGAYFEQWLGERSYDPEIIQRDLDIVHGLGMNSVAVFTYHLSMEDQNLLDFMRRCENLGIYVNLSIRHGAYTPAKGFDELMPRVLEVIRHYRLQEHPSLFVYDLAWEPMWMTQQHRRDFDADWEAWIVERYGSLANAEKDWDFPVPRGEDGAVTNPDATQTRDQGPWARMTAAYRRFLDMQVYKHYSRARAMVREADPGRAVSFRKAEAGNPTLDWMGIIPYDFPYLAAAVDVLEPEGYGRIGDWDRVKPGWFTRAYARWAGPDLPMLWAEAGVTAWDIGHARSTEKKLAFQGEYLADIYRMLTGSRADGIYFWWYPGGFRFGENSDYGIINPDGTDRPSTRSIREHGQAYLDAPPAKPVDHWITFDRDAHPHGLTGVYSEAEEAFWKAIDEGLTPGLRTEGTGTDSGNCPLVAVGNTPCNGTNPPKYLGGFFDTFEVRDAVRGWVSVEGAAEVAVKPGDPVIARVAITNLGEAKWLASGAGAVTLRVGNGPAIPMPHDVERHESITLEDVTLAAAAKPGDTLVVRLDATDRTPFGPVARITLKAAEEPLVKATPGRPPVGAIRWDAWFGTASSVGLFVEQTLAPEHWHDRLPFYGRVVGTNAVEARATTQEVIDAEIEYANAAGLDYWAFVTYPEDDPLSLALKLYLSSEKKGLVNFCLNLQGGWEGRDGMTAWPGRVARYVRMFEDPAYQTVAGGRPLVYLYSVEDLVGPGRFETWDEARAAFDQLRDAAVARGIPSPYVVAQGWSPGEMARLAGVLGLDAVGAYASSAGAKAGTYASLAAHTERWWDAFKATGMPVAPLVTAGWDMRPRVETPVPWVQGGDIEKYEEAPTPKELATHLKNALAWCTANPDAEPQAILIYAWNEFDEGGWICPTLSEGTARIDAIGGVLAQ